MTPLQKPRGIVRGEPVNPFEQAYINTVAQEALEKLRTLGIDTTLTDEERQVLERIHKRGWSMRHPDYDPYTNIFGDGFGY